MSSTPRSPAHSSARERSLAFLAACVVAAVAWLHGRILLNEFAAGSYLEDGGWLAYLFQAGDVWLTGPRSIETGSFYAHHLSPYIYGLGVLLDRVAGLSGAEVFALHQGFFFALFALSLFLAARGPHVAPCRGWAFMSALAIGALASLLFRAAEYPHFEIALLALASFAVVAGLRGWDLALALAGLALPMVREDGGLYLAWACLSVVAIRSSQFSRRRRLGLAALALGGVGLAFLEQGLQVFAFPECDTVRQNLAPQTWALLDAATIGARLIAVARDPSLALIAFGSLGLLIYDRRYGAGFAFILPLLILFLLSPRELISTFSIYYALPWLLPCVVWVAVLAERPLGQQNRMEPWVVFAMALMLASPVQAAAGLGTAFWQIPRLAFDPPAGNLADMARFAREMAQTARRRPGARLCVDGSVAGLDADAYVREDLLSTASNLGVCSLLLVLSGSPAYASIAGRAEQAGLRRRKLWQAVEVWGPSEPP